MTAGQAKLEYRRPVRDTIESFTSNLLGSEPMMQYVLDRGITIDQVRDNMVGFCPPYCRHWFPLLRGRITVTISDAHGRPVALAGRQYDPMRKATHRSFRESHRDDAKSQLLIDKWEAGKWINEPYQKARHLFNLHRAKHFARKMGYIVCVEGYFDALVLENFGLPNTVALCGTRLTAFHAALLYRYTDRIIVLMDGDAAGENALQHIIPRCNESNIQCKVLSLPPKCDPDEFVLKRGHRLHQICEQLLDSDYERIDIT